MVFDILQEGSVFLRRKIPCTSLVYSFVGCTVAPGFEFEDFEMGSRKKLVGEYGEVEEEIVRLTEGLP